MNPAVALPVRKLERESGEASSVSSTQDSPPAVSLNARFAQAQAEQKAKEEGDFWWTKNAPYWLPPPPEWGPMPPNMFTAYYHQPKAAPMSTPNYGVLYFGRHPERDDYYPSHMIMPADATHGAPMNPAKEAISFLEMDERASPLSPSLPPMQPAPPTPHFPSLPSVSDIISKPLGSATTEGEHPLANNEDHPAASAHQADSSLAEHWTNLQAIQSAISDATDNVGPLGSRLLTPLPEIQ